MTMTTSPYIRLLKVNSFNLLYENILEALNHFCYLSQSFLNYNGQNSTQYLTTDLRKDNLATKAIFHFNTRFSQSSVFGMSPSLPKHPSAKLFLLPSTCTFRSSAPLKRLSSYVITQYLFLPARWCFSLECPVASKPKTLSKKRFSPFSCFVEQRLR